MQSFKWSIFEPFRRHGKTSSTIDDSNRRAILDSSLSGAEKEAVARDVLTAALHLICDGD
ncbi:MAG: hypothetical protein K8F91_13775 [Candidatus Obscuribacterales bacterium]|nr:hypothetical protein [Candidatus Obscuribacterales bacterium]